MENAFNNKLYNYGCADKKNECMDTNIWMQVLDSNEN